MNETTAKGTGDVELCGLLNMVQARLESGPASAEEWEAIRVALHKGSVYAANRRREIMLREVDAAGKAEG